MPYANHVFNNAVSEACFRFLNSCLIANYEFFTNDVIGLGGGVVYKIPYRRALGLASKGILHTRGGVFEL